MSPRARTIALGLGGVLIAAALALGVPALLTHAEARGAWTAERQALGQPGYDPARSDRLYARSRDGWRRSGLAGQLLGAGLLLFTLGAVRPRPTPAARASWARTAAASAVDGSLGAGVLALAWLDAGESAALRLATAAAPWASALPFAALPAGTSAGLRAFGLGARPGARPLLAVVLWPLALLGALHLRVARVQVGCAPPGVRSGHSRRPPTRDPN